jgi:PhnB protein
MSNKITGLVPYLYFEGTCEEALNFYSKIFNGQVDIESRYDNPAMKAPKEFHDKVLHGSLKFDHYTFLACDILPGEEAKTQTGNVSLSISADNAETGKKIFEQLSKGGKVNMAFEKQFWGAWHGNFTDRYGISWMINCD